MWVALRRIPAPLLFAQLATLALALLGIVLFEVAPHAKLGGGLFEDFMRTSDKSIDVLSAVGLAWLAKRLDGVPRWGVRIAMFATAATLVLFVAQIVLVMFVGVRNVMFLVADLLPILDAIFVVAVGVGLGVATRRWYWIPIAAVAALFTTSWFAIGHYGLNNFLLEFDGLRLIYVSVQLAMTALVARETAPYERPALVGRGLVRSAWGLWGLALATCGLAGFTTLVGMDRSYEHTGDVQLLVALSTGLAPAGLIALVLGALTTIRGRGGLAAWLVVSSVMVSLAIAWQFTVRFLALVHQLGVWDALSDPSGRSDPWQWSDRGFLPSASSQLLVVLALGALLVAVAVDARRRGLEELRGRAITACCTLAGLAIVAMTAQRVLPSLIYVSVTPLQATIIIATHAALAAGWLVAAHIFRRAANELGAQNLPTAKVVS